MKKILVCNADLLSLSRPNRTQLAVALGPAPGAEAATAAWPQPSGGPRQQVVLGGPHRTNREAPPPHRAPGPCGWEQVLALQGSGATRADGCVGRLGPGQGAHTVGSWARESRPCADRMTSDSATGPAGPGQGPVSWDHPPLSLGPKPGLAACMNRLAHSGRPRGDGQGCCTVSWGARTGPTCRAPPHPQRVPQLLASLPARVHLSLVRPPCL